MERIDTLKRQRTNDRFTITALIVTMIVNQTGVVIISPLAVDIAADFDVSVAWASQLRTIAALSSAVIAPWIGVLSERIGRRPLLLFGLAMIGLTGLGSSLAPNLVALAVVQFFTGIGVACLLSMGLAAVGDYFAPDRRAWAVGMVTIGQPLAWVVGLPLIGLFADAGGWRWSFFGVPFLFSLVGFWFVSRLPRVPSSSTPRSHGQPSVLRQVLGDRSAASWVLSELCTYIGWAGTLTFLGTFYIARFGLSAGTASPLLALTALGFAVGSLFAHRAARRARPQTVILLGSLLSAGFLSLGMGISLSLVPTTLLLTLFGLSQGFRGATSSALGLRQSPTYRGAIMALRASVVQFGYVFGGLIGGVLLATSGLAAIGVVLSFFFVLAGLAVYLFVDERSAVSEPT